MFTAAVTSWIYALSCYDSNGVEDLITQNVIDRLSYGLTGSTTLPMMSVKVKSMGLSTSQATVQVTVTDQATGSPVGGATVSVFDDNGRQAGTGATGSNGIVTLRFSPCFAVETRSRLPCDGSVTKFGYQDAEFLTPG